MYITVTYRVSDENQFIPGYFSSVYSKTWATHRASIAKLMKRGKKMRTKFSIELRADIDSGDKDTRKVFLDLCKVTAQQLYAQSLMLAKRPPTIAVMSDDAMHGQEEIQLFVPPKE